MKPHVASVYRWLAQQEIGAKLGVPGIPTGPQLIHELNRRLSQAKFEDALAEFHDHARRGAITTRIQLDPGQRP